MPLEITTGIRCTLVRIPCATFLMFMYSSSLHISLDDLPIWGKYTLYAYTVCRIYITSKNSLKKKVATLILVKTL